MLSTRPTRIGVFVMALVVALSTIGIASALWSKTLTVDGSVATGTVSIEFVNHVDLYENETYIENGLKDVAACFGSIGPDYPDRMSVDIVNGYPSFECWAVVHVTNTGNIPVHIYRPDITSAATPSEVTIAALDAPVTLPDNTVLPACYLDDAQLHTGDVAHCTVYFHVEQGALQDHTYTFEALFEGRQYNEPRP